MAGHAEELLFLPGASGNLEFWRPVSERLQSPATRRLLGYPGFGGFPADRDVTCFRDLVTRVVSTITKPVDLIAQSMGGVIAMLAVLEKPQLVRHLVLSVTSGGIDLSSYGAADWRADLSVRQSTAPSWFIDDRTDLSERLREVSIPVLLLWGDADPISPVAVGERLAELLPSSELIVLQGGTHDLAFERADEVAPLIERHCKREHLNAP